MNKLLLTVAKRLGLGLFTLLVISLIIFLAVDMLPGDIATEILGQMATPDAVAAIRAELGLNLPIHERYLDWLGGLVQGDLGNSLATDRPVASLIGDRLMNTLYLAGLAALISVPLALGLGVLAALYRNTLVDRVVSVSSLAAISMPEFFIAYVLILFISVQLGWLPSLSKVDADQPWLDRIQLMILPAITLTFVTCAHMMRMTRATIINLLSSPYIEMARLKGLGPWRVIVRHTLPNAWAPIVNVVVMNIAYLITGVVVVEVVFVYPGLGQLMVDSVAKRDLPVVQAASLIFAATYILFNLIADVVSIVSNPKLLHPK
ncbi:ABC transporter permease [Marinobacter sp. BGYM27]|uniref:ABC transporter permease n=1 Tax=Marinobacter sp. BGYM27 TaxID=2975597 RepID=UPI0021A4FF27|nr:ABC transporter permease [Marinobacter sp. BGYM27]MDG5499631.1 ABC transporter permease [Marinobacter sp. BGYM27]